MCEKFENIESLIKSYYDLVVNNTNGLPPYASFEQFFERPSRIRRLVDQLNPDSRDEEKIDAILSLWATGHDIIVGGTPDKTYNSKKLLHSASNKGRIKSALVSLTNENLLTFSNKLYTYITNSKFLDNNILDPENTSFYQGELSPDQDNIQRILKNRINAPLSEIIFWYFYKSDQYPILNSRAKNSRKLLNNVFAINQEKNDITFNNRCMSIDGFQDINSDNHYISKQLMLDQLFFSIDEIKSMKEVDELYDENNRDNDIYIFYKKLWNTIRDKKRLKVHEKLNQFKNIIYHGAPGTGKTYELKREIKEHLDWYSEGKSEFIQFHSSYYYEDFIGGLKPISNENNNISLEFKNGIFKELCKKAAQYEIAYHKHNNLDERILDNTTIIDENEIILRIGNKDFIIDNKSPVLSQFPPFFILIDEINRADLSKVFGELLFSIEDDYRGFQHKFKLSTSQMETDKTAVYWDETNKEALFFVPHNLYIRGTMNDIDKSIDSIDFAFRRRFKWVNKNYDEKILKDMLYNHYDNDNYDNIDSYIKSCTTLNKEIINKISITNEAHKIGHAIFRNIIKYAPTQKKINTESKEKLFDNHIEPIIYNYLIMDYGNEKEPIKTFKEKFQG